jgi:hypothetical protein
MEMEEEAAAAEEEVVVVGRSSGSGTHSVPLSIVSSGLMHVYFRSLGVDLLTGPPV